MQHLGAKGLFFDHFAPLPDPRVVGRSSHKLINIVVIGILGTICGAEGWDHLEVFGEGKQNWLGTFLDASRDAERRHVPARLQRPRSLGLPRCFIGWMQP